MLTIRVNVTGLDQVQSLLPRLKDVFSSFSQEMKTIGDYLLDFYSNEVYTSEGSTYGTPWAPLSPKYEAQKAKRWGSTTILVASGRMKGSNTLMTTDTYLIVQNTTDYAIYHQQGTPKMPQRVLMVIDDTRQKQIVDLFTQTLKSRIESL